MTTKAPAATVKRDKHKSRIMDWIDLASLHGTDIKSDRGVEANRRRSKGNNVLAPLTKLQQVFFRKRARSDYDSLS